MARLGLEPRASLLPCEHSANRANKRLVVLWLEQDIRMTVSDCRSLKSEDMMVSRPEFIWHDNSNDTFAI